MGSHQEHHDQPFQASGFKSAIMNQQADGILPDKIQDQNRSGMAIRQLGNELRLKQQQRDKQAFSEKGNDHDGPENLFKNVSQPKLSQDVFPDYRFPQSQNMPSSSSQYKPPDQLLENSQEKPSRPQSDKYQYPMIRSNTKYDDLFNSQKKIEPPSIHSISSKHYRPHDTTQHTRNSNCEQQSESNPKRQRNNEWTPDLMCHAARRSFDNRTSENLFFEFHPSATSTVKRPPLSDDLETDYGDIEIIG